MRIYIVICLQLGWWTMRAWLCLSPCICYFRKLFRESSCCNTCVRTNWLYSIWLQWNLPSSCTCIYGALISLWQNNYVYSVHNVTLDYGVISKSAVNLQKVITYPLSAEVDNTDLFWFWFCFIYQNGCTEYLPSLEFHTAFWGQCVTALQRGLGTGKQLVQGQERAGLGLRLWTVGQSLCL